MKENILFEELNYINPDYGFKDLLANLTKQELTEIRQLWEFEGISQLNKAELVEVLITRITKNIESWLRYLGSEQIEFLKEIIFRCENYSGAYVELNKMTYFTAEYFQQRGVVFFGKHEDSALFLIPEELRRKIKSVLNDKELKKQIKLNDKYIKYAVACAIYYGVVSPDILYETLERYMEVKWDIDPLDVVVEYGEYSLAAYSTGPFFILSAVENPHEILSERESRSDLDYYIPSKKEIENAYKKGHESWNLAQRRLKKKLTKDYDLPVDEAEILTFQFSLLIKNEVSSAEIIRILAEDLGIDIFEDKNDLIQLINDFHNSTRLWVLKGHTPDELFHQNI
jgi:hypothetical protein